MANRNSRHEFRHGFYVFGELCKLLLWKKIGAPDLGCQTVFCFDNEMGTPQIFNKILRLWRE
jgi:hypothetical protein